MLNSILNSRFGKTACLVLVSTLFSVAVGWLTIASPDAKWLLPTTVIPVIVSMPIGYYIFGREALIQTLNQELSRQLAEDSLTGAMSRRGFFDLNGDNTPPTDGVVMIADLDHFKSVNDTYGHAAGDAVLCAAVQAIKRVVGDQGYVARLGGEEFGIWLPDMDPMAGRRLAGAICAAVACKTVIWEGQPIATTTSIGGSFARRAQSFDAALSQADAALYRAKSAGRNQCEFHDWTQGRRIRDRVTASANCVLISEATA